MTESKPKIRLRYWREQYDIHTDTIWHIACDERVNLLIKIGKES